METQTRQVRLKRIEIREDGLARVLDEETLPASKLNRFAKPDDEILVKNRVLVVKPVAGDVGQYLATVTIYSKPENFKKNEPSNHVRGNITGYLLKAEPPLPEDLYFSIGKSVCTGCSTEIGWCDYSFPVQFYIENSQGRKK